MWNRRRFLESLSGFPLLGGLLPAAGIAWAKSLQRDFFAELGVRRFISAAGTYTVLTASLMPEEVVQAMSYASRHYVGLNELHDKVGEL